MARSLGSRPPWFAVPLALSVLAIGLLSAGVRLDREAHHGSKSPAMSTGTGLLSWRRVPVLVAGPAAEQALDRRISALLGPVGNNGCVGVAAGGRTIYNFNEDALLSPASLNKLTTATVAIDLLGRDRRLRTEVRADAREGATVKGNLYLIGGGDPLLFTDDFAALFDPPVTEHSRLETLADRVVAAGVRTITGTVVGDESRYDTQRANPLWPARFVNRAETGALSALSVDAGLDRYPVAPSKTSPSPHPSPDPAATAAARFADLLRARGVAIAKEPPPRTGRAPAAASQVASLDGVLLRGLVGEMLRESDNTTAELLTKEIGHEATGSPGTTAAGLRAALGHLRDRHLVVAGLHLADGSGLALANKQNCTYTLSLLDGAGPFGDLARGLAVAGRSGTARRRFAGSALVGRLRVKTGTLNEATGLAGYLRARSGIDLSFVYMFNSPPGRLVTAEQVEVGDRLAEALDTYPEVDLAALGPQR